MKLHLVKKQWGTACVLQARSVSKHYRLGDVDVPALKKVSLELQPRDFVAIAGSSGSGKTTLLNLLGCLDSPTSGEILVDGVETTRLTSRALAKLRAERIGFIFQNFNLLPVLTAFENIEYPLSILKVPTAERRTRVMEALDRVGLANFARHRPAQLSGGQRQRVALARALVKQPTIVLADEPTASLDTQNAKSILDLMHTLNREEGTTFLFSSHDPLILSGAARVVYLSDGMEISKETSHAG